MLLVAALSAGVPAQATPVHKAQVVAVAPVAKQLDRSFIGRVVVTAVADVADPRQELVDAYERISNAQKPLEPEFSSFIADNFWDLL